MYHEDADGFIRQMVEDLWSAVDRTIHHNYVERQTIPFVVSQVADAVTQIIEVIQKHCFVCLYETYDGRI